MDEAEGLSAAIAHMAATASHMAMTRIQYLTIISSPSVRFAPSERRVGHVPPLQYA